VEGNGRGLILRHSLGVRQRKLGESTKSFRVVGYPAEILSRSLPNTAKELLTPKATLLGILTL
jgi:hypothetical protein